MHRKSVFTIPSGVPFLRTFAQYLLNETRADQKSLADYRIFLPTRRACRNLRNAFLDLTDGKPLLLPRMQPLGDVSEDELLLEINDAALADALLSMPSAMTPIRRQLLLAQTILKIPGFTQSMEQAMMLAKALGRLMDQIHTESLSLSDLPNLVEEDALAEHWQVTVEFLTILSDAWPKILAEEGKIDASDRRNRLLRMLADHWQDNPPNMPVIAAGSTGSIPATGTLMDVISTLPNGMVILPGLDHTLDDESWALMDDTHPQGTMKEYLATHQLTRSDVKILDSDIHPNTDRQFLATEMMRPAERTEDWKDLDKIIPQSYKKKIQETISNIHMYSCDTPREEALTIAIAMRDVLETPGKTAALITPDRALAGRVAAQCRRWKIDLDDSAGTPLHQTQIGGFFRLTANAFLQDFKPGALAAMLKHAFCRMGYEAHDYLKVRNISEIHLLRGLSPKPDIEGLVGRLHDQKNDDHVHLKDEDFEVIMEFINRLGECYKPFEDIQEQALSISDWVNAHIHVMEMLSDNHPASLWAGDEGEMLVQFLSDLKLESQQTPDMMFKDYIAVADNLITGLVVRPKFGTHPRLSILGQLEARLLDADIVILSGLNEGSWPSEPSADPWMSRAMRKNFGLPSSERSIGLAAHDFVQGFCQKNVILTRSLNNDGAPTTPSRWLQRLETVLDALGFDAGILGGGGVYLSYARQIDVTGLPAAPVSRPAPKPHVNKRPTSLSATRIETWMRDPYAIYARYILKLKSLDPIEQDSEASIKGTIIHDTLEQFTAQYPDELPAGAHGILQDIGKSMMDDVFENPVIWGFWWPRFMRLSDWFINHEQDWRKKARNISREERGSVTLPVTDMTSFTISAIADRIDMLEDGLAIIDYKTGTLPTKKDISSGFSSQLPLEGLIAQKGGFKDAGMHLVSYLGYWKLSGGQEAGKEDAINQKIIQDLIGDAESGLTNLIIRFLDDDVPYYSLPRPDKAPPAAWQDYAHLARVQEWIALGDDNDGEAYAA